MAVSEVEFALSLGSNLGDRLGHLQYAIKRLQELIPNEFWQFSSIYETSPYGKTDQPDYLNLVAAGKTSMPPHQLLDVCHQIEQERHRERLERWGARTLDIDILYYGDTVMNDVDLTLPHPEMLRREFVMLPLAEIKDGMVQGSSSVRFFGNIDILSSEMNCNGEYDERT